MRHLRKVQKFHRPQEARKRLKIDLVKALIERNQIETFQVRAKWVRSFFESLVTQLKKADGNVELQFKKLRYYLDEKTARRFIEVIYPKVKDRQSGYLRVVAYQKPFSTHKKAILSILEN